MYVPLSQTCISSGFDKNQIGDLREGRETFTDVQFTHGIIHDVLWFHQICAIWVSKQFTEHICNCLTICQGLVNHYCNECGGSLRQRVTEDGLWIHHYAPDSKH